MQMKQVKLHVPRLSFRPSFSSAGWGRTNHVDLPNQLFVRTWMGALHLGCFNVKSLQVYSMYGSRPKCSEKSTNRLQSSYGFPDVTSTLFIFVWLATSTLDPCIANVAWCFLCHVCMLFFVLLFSPMLHLHLEKCVNYSCLVRPMSLYCPGLKQSTQALHSPATGQFLKDLFTISEPDQDLIYVEFGVEPNHFLQRGCNLCCPGRYWKSCRRVVRWLHALSVKKPVNLHMQKFDEDSETPCPNCPFKLQTEGLCHTMSYYVMLLTSTSVAEVWPLKQQSKNEPSPQSEDSLGCEISVSLCAWLSDFEDPTQQNPQDCTTGLPASNHVGRMDPRHQGEGNHVHSGHAIWIWIWNHCNEPHMEANDWRSFENVSHESTLSLDHLGGWHRMPKACIHLKALWNSQNWRECSLFWSEFQCRSIRKQSSVNPGFNSSNVWQIKCQSWKAQTWSWEFCHQKRLRKVQAKYVFDCCADLPSTRIWSPGI